MELTSSSTTWQWPSLLLVLPTITLALSLLFLLHDRHAGRSTMKKQQKKNELPPGPSTLLFVVRFLALRRSILDMGPVLRELHGRYGPVISVHLFRTVVFVADRVVAHHVLVQSGDTFDDRPALSEPVSLFTSGGRDISTTSYGAYWRLVRRNLAAVALHPTRLALFVPTRRRARDELIRYFLRSRGGEQAVEVRPAFRRALYALYVHMCFGVTLGPEALDEVQELQSCILRAFTSFPVFSFFPAITKKLFRRRWAGCLAVRRRQEEIFIPLMNARREQQRDAGADLPCYADDLLALRFAEEGGRPLTDAELVALCSEFLNAGVESTAILTEWILAELVNRPAMQSKLYEELNNFGGGDDLPYGPYLKAVVLEALRLHPPTHFLIPHGVQSDGAEISGYAVPKGSEINCLHADFGRDEAHWTAALDFRPERFLDGGEGHGVDVTGSREIKMLPFGAGRRMCPGYTAALPNIEYLVAGLVRQLEWLPAAEGKLLDMAEKTDFITVMKHPLRAHVVART